MKPSVCITVLVENTASRTDMLTEHGLSLWIEYGEKRILFDTGQSDILIKNAKTLGVDLAQADAIVLSHGHYDHAGGLSAVLDIAAKATVYLHPAAIEPKFSRKESKGRFIGMSEMSKKAIRNRKVVWTEAATSIFSGITITGQIPRANNFEDVGGDFFLDENCRKPDELLDDQALFIESPNGLIVVLGCGHAGAVNTLHYIADLSGRKNFYAALGGTHLLNASEQRIDKTMAAFKEYQIQKIGPAHCTGNKAFEKFKSVFPEQYFVCSGGTKLCQGLIVSGE